MTMTTTYQIKATQVFGGEARRTKIYEVDRVTGHASVESVLARYEGAGDGWGVHLAVADVETARGLGAYETDGGYWLLPIPGRDPIALTIDPSTGEV